MRSVGALVAAIGTVLALLCQTAGAWWLVQVGRHERSLIIGHTNACGQVIWHHTETPRMVVIWESVEPPRGNLTCPAILRISQITIPLSRPLAGRHVEGGSRAYIGWPPCRRGKAGPFCPKVSRLTGLSPADASFLLSGRGLHSVVRVAGRTAGLARVVSQSPAAAARNPSNRVVHVNILR
jgi:hypothetical protein